jgi:L-ascorbate metabolism protein UlaG (beta-lactamase superfamily)
MELSYLGLSSFKMRFKNGMTLLMDPFDPEYVGLSFPKQKADLVTVSHDHKDHNYLDGVSGPAKREEMFLISEEGEYEVGGVEVAAIKTFHDKNDGKDRGENLVMVIRCEEMVICHLGDLGHPLSEKQIEGIGAVDVLLVPVGGEYTIDAKEASDMITNMSPSIVVPMHYKIKGMNKEFEVLKEVSDFLDKTGLEVMTEGVDKMKIDARTLPENTKVAVLGSSNGQS